jgi:ribosomal protein S8
MSIDTKLTTLGNLRKQFKEASATRKVIQNQKKACEHEIQDYLAKNNLPRVTNSKISIISNHKKMRKRLSKVEKNRTSSGVID